MPHNLSPIPTKQTTIMPTWHILQMMMMKMVVDEDASDKDDDNDDDKFKTMTSMKERLK